MQKKLVVILMICATLVVGREAYAACGPSTPMIHQNSYLQCADGKEVAGFAYQLSAPTAANTGTENIICEETGSGSCLSGGTFGDNKVTVETDWGNTGIVGCPVVGGIPQRVVVELQCNDGTGLVLSLSGQVGYLVDVVLDNNPDPVTGAFPPAIADNRAGRPHLVSINGNQLVVHFDAPQKVYTDCDANSVGQAFGSCTDSFVPTTQLARVFSSVQPCGTRPDLRLASWTQRPEALGPTGDMTMTLAAVTQPPTCTAADQSTCLCTYIGSTAAIGGGGVTPVEGSGLTGFISVSAGGAGAPSPVALGVRAALANGKVAIQWRTDVELGLVGFNVLADGGKKGLTKVNDSLIAARGNGGGTSYSVSIERGKFQNSRTVIIESVLSDQTSLKSAPAKF